MQAGGGKRLAVAIPPRVCAVSRHFRCLPAASAGTLEAVPLSRIAWLVTVAASFVVALLLLFSDYNGYALLAVAVGLSAAINLR